MVAQCDLEAEKATLFVPPEKFSWPWDTCWYGADGATLVTVVPRAGQLLRQHHHGKAEWAHEPPAQGLQMRAAEEMQ